MDKVDELVAQRVQQALASAGMGLCDLAARLGVPDEVLSARLAGTSSFTVYELAAIAALIGRRTVDLVPIVRGR